MRDNVDYRVWLVCYMCCGAHALQNLKNYFLSLDEAIASRVAILIVSGLDRWNRFWSQLPKRAIKWASPQPPTCTWNQDIQKSPFQIVAKRLELTVCGVMPWIIVQLLPNPQVSNHRSNTVAYHQCGDDLVTFLLLDEAIAFRAVFVIVSGLGTCVNAFGAR